MKDKLNWGILSTAKHADGAYVPAIQASRNGHVHAVASRQEQKAKAFADKHGIERVHGSYEALLADPEVDVIYNPLPNAMHAEWSIKAVEAGKPVLCEKPLSGNAQEAEAMQAAVERTGKLIAEAYMYRLHPLNRKAREIVRSGRLGDVRIVRAQFTAGANDPTNIRFQKDLAGGAFRDLGGYCTSLMRFLFESEPEEIVALAQEHPNGGVDFRMSGALRFPGDRLATFDCGHDLPFACSYEVHGTKGRLLVPEGAMVASKTKSQEVLVWDADGHEAIPTEIANHYQLMAEHFVDAVQGKTELEFPISDAVANMKVMDRVMTAAGF